MTSLKSITIFLLKPCQRARRGSLKKKYLRVNHPNSMTKLLRKAIIKISKLRNDFLKDRNDASQSAYRKQRNLCVSLYQKIKQNMFLENKFQKHIS